MTLVGRTKPHRDNNAYNHHDEVENYDTEVKHWPRNSHWGHSTIYRSRGSCRSLQVAGDASLPLPPSYSGSRRTQPPTNGRNFLHRSAKSIFSLHVLASGAAPESRHQTNLTILVSSRLLAATRWFPGHSDPWTCKLNHATCQ